MTDKEYKATVETEEATFTFEGDNPSIVSAQISRIPVNVKQKEIEEGVPLSTNVHRYLIEQAEKREQERKKNRPPRSRR